MNSFLYRLLYFLRKARWDSGIVPPEVVEAFQQGDIPPGPALDLGCGTGTNAIYMATMGRQVIGIDFVPQAIARARKKAHRAGVSDRTRFFKADVTRLGALNLPQCAFALDIGCFHGLDGGDRSRYARGLAELLLPGGRYMVYAIAPQGDGRKGMGVTPEQVRAVFAPWFRVERVEQGAFGERQSAWFWMKKNGE